MSGIPAGAGSLLGQRLGKYEIVALLALGGTAEIYLARVGGAAGFEKYVVVKCLHDHLADDTDFVKMFLDEARLASMLDHTNIVQTYELGEHENRYFMVMEFLAGLSLAMVVRRAAERLQGGRVPVPLVFNAAAQAAAGLHYAHERTASGKPLNMVHRDVSPQNLVICFEGLVKVVDFGIARADQRDTKTKAGTIKGKFAYMSPEQCVATNVDRRTDVFALGVIVHELVTGRRLFKRNSAYETYQAVLECAVPPPSTVNNELDPAVDEIVMRACAKEPDQRYPTAEAFGDALLGYLHHRGKATGPAEIARFLDEHFAQEIDEHGERMRELIASREVSGEVGGEAGMNWGGDDDKVNETVDLGGKDIIEVRPSEASLESVVARLQTNADPPGEDPAADDEAVPADRTRIETNPFDKVRELHEEVRRRGNEPTVPAPQGSVSGIAPLPAPPTVAIRPKSEPGAPKRATFPDLANLPTQIAESTPSPSAQPRPSAPAELAATNIASEMQNVDAPRAPIIPSSPGASGSMAARAGALSATQEAVRLSQLHEAQSGPPAAIDPRASPYPVVSGRPTSSDLAPSSLGPAQRPTFRDDHSGAAPQVAPSSGQFVSPQQAANFMSPVGDRYAPNVDWEAAAAQSAAPIPRWLLVMFFVGALFIALMLTIIVAKIIR